MNPNQQFNALGMGSILMKYSQHFIEYSILEIILGTLDHFRHFKLPMEDNYAIRIHVLRIH